MRGVRMAVCAAVLAVAGTGCTDDERAGLAADPTTQAPFTGRTLADGELAEVDSLDGATVRPVEDGVVRSLETTVEILEFGTADELAGGAGLRHGRDATLLVFTMATTHNEREHPAELDVENDVSAVVVVDGEQRDVPDWNADGTHRYAVAVPDDRREVTFELRYGRFTQAFDLLEGAPKGARPAGLYRAEDATVVESGALQPSAFEVDALGNGTFETYTVTATAELGYLTYAGTEPPSGDDRAWLTVTATEDVSEAGSCSATIDAYSVTDGDGTRYAPVASASEVAEPGILDGTTSTVTFEVPADLTTATLTVAPATVPCQVSTATFEPVPARGQALIPIRLPAE